MEEKTITNTKRSGKSVNRSLCDHDTLAEFRSVPVESITGTPATSLAEKAAVMQAAEKGQVILFRYPGQDWRATREPLFNWKDAEYCISPQQPKVRVFEDNELIDLIGTKLRRKCGCVSIILGLACGAKGCSPVDGRVFWGPLVVDPSELLLGFTFLDGRLCGVEVESVDLFPDVKDT